MKNDDGTYSARINFDQDYVNNAGTTITGDVYKRQVPAVREHLLSLQRQIARENDIIMDGRDIGTCILPNADVKIFLTASAEERARRRYLELQSKGDNTPYDVVLADIKERDYRDTHRDIAPLKQAEDAVYPVSYTHLSTHSRSVLQSEMNLI